MPPTGPGLDLKDALLAGLRAGRWRPGEKLPTERQMSAQHAVGRTAVRHALGELKRLGLLTQTVGSGTYVAEDFAGKLPAGPSAAISPSELMEARLALEPPLIDLVVRNATAGDLDVLEEACRRADAAATLAEFERWDGAFHHGLAEATRNGFVAAVFALLSRARGDAEWGQLKRRSATPERRAAYGREHRALLAALRDRDADAARTVLLAHLHHVRRNMFE